MNSKIKNKNLQNKLKDELALQKATQKRIDLLKKELQANELKISKRTSIISKYESICESMQNNSSLIFKEIENKNSEIWSFEMNVKSKLEKLAEEEGLPVSFSFAGNDFYYYPNSINEKWTKEELEILSEEIGIKPYSTGIWNLESIICV